MPELERRPADAAVEEVCEIVARDGALILEDVLSPEQVDRALSELRPYIDATQQGQDEFVGKCTRRTGALVARSAASREMIVHDAILPAARKFLEPWCDAIQLHLSQVITIQPGETAQQIHRDRWAWGTYLERSLQPQFNTIWALTDFTEENGATHVAPGSVDWEDTRRPTPEESCRAEMTAGSVLVYSGSVFHGGGANASEADRVGVNLTYTLGWLRQEENQYLACPPEVARHLDPELQSLIGYARGGYALGYYTPPLAVGEGPELVGPEWALGATDENGRFGTEELFEKLNEQIRAADDV